MGLIDDNAKAVTAEGFERVFQYLHMTDTDDFTFATWPEGSNGFFLEMLKMDLVAMAAVIENRLAQLYASQDVTDHAGEG